MKTVYILLPVHNRREVTQRFIISLQGQTFRNFHLVLIDDGSSDGTQEMARTGVDRLSVIQGTGEWWWAGALQQGFEWLIKQEVDPSDLVLIANDDTEFPKEFLQEAVAIMEGRSKLLVLAPSFSRQTGKLLGGGVRVDWKTLSFMEVAKPEEVNCLSTRGLFLAWGDFLNLGGFYPRLLPHYLSDYEFTIRAHRRGLTLEVANNLKMLVDEGTTGFHQIEGHSFLEYCRKYFSKKSDSNPFAWTMFIALACPWPWKPVNWLRVWYGTTKKIVRAMIS